MLLKVTGAVSGAVDVEEVESVTFASLPINGESKASESQLEALIAANVELFVNASDDNDPVTLLVIGRQVRTKTNRRMDLVALDGTGGLTLIEVKRDAADVQSRADHAEIQAVRYAASLGKLRTADELVNALYARYVDRYETEELRQHGGGRSAEEWARKKLVDFMNDNGIDPARLNHSQRIVLIGAGFDRDTISAAAWMAKNGIPIRVIQVEPRQLEKTFFLDIRQLIPVPAYEDFYVDLTTVDELKGGGKAVPGSAEPREYRLRLAALLEARKVNLGDKLLFKLDPNRAATLSGPKSCRFEGKEMSLLEWTKKVSGWAAVNIYEWVIHEPTGKLLEVLRTELEEETIEKASCGTSELPSVALPSTTL